MANKRKRTPEEIEEMRKWRKMPWKTTSVVMQADGTTRPYDPERDLVEHIVQPLCVTDCKRRSAWNAGLIL